MNKLSEVTDRILIVGGTGFVGRHLARHCLKTTRFVTCLGTGDPNRMPMYPDGMEVIKADIRDRIHIEKSVSGRSFDYVFNLGGYIDHTPYFKGGRRFIDAHFTGLLNLLDCLDRSTLKGFVQIGSSDEYGNAPAPQKEDMREQPISPYSAAKVAATHFVQMLHRTEDFPGVVLRFFLVYGPGQDDGRFLPQIINACLKNEEFKTSEGKQLRDFCHVDDVVEAMIAAAVLPPAKGCVVNVGSGNPVSIREVIQKVTVIAGGGRPLWGEHPYRTGENMSLYADIGLAKKLLDWEPRISLEEGLRKTIDYYRGRGEKSYKEGI